MILLDKVLIFIVLMVVGVLLFLFFRQMRKDSLWAGPYFDPFGFWNMMEKFHETLLSRRKKKEEQNQ